MLDVDRRPTIHCGRRGIQERNAPRLAEFEQLQRDAVVVVHHVAAIALGRVRARALMQHGAHRGQAAVGDPAAEIVLVHVLGYLAIDQVDELVAFARAPDCCQ
ncbi:hypothetical protein G6F57_021724 [Rhizopus arrhizus]|nr:hypothetical protein G6F57_021724 [Rhizopus arrhizus]